MKLVHVICEGQTEANFVKKVLSSYFADKGVCFNAPVVLTSTDKRHGNMHKGGMSTFFKAKNTIDKVLSMARKNDVYVTTMFDYYHIPSDTPGYSESKGKNDVYERVEFIEQQINLLYPDYSREFFPYLQLHEFETLIFASLDKLSEKYFEYDISPLQECLKEIKNPELINSSEDTAPSKRIMQCIPSYDKVQMGVEVLAESDFSIIRKNCRHFDEWITKIEKLAI